LVRTLISLPETDKNWLDRYAARQGVAMTELIRRAVALLRARVEADAPSLEQLLDETRGVWIGEDGLRYQRRVRDEW
jgi:hypothetical protein